MSIREIRQRQEAQSDTRVLAAHTNWLLKRSAGETRNTEEEIEKADAILALGGTLVRPEKGITDGCLHPSSISGCMTRVVLQKIVAPYLPVVTTPDPRSQKIFDLGTAIHAMLQAQLWLAGVVDKDGYGMPMVEVSALSEELNLAGTADFVVKKGVYSKTARGVGELKSMNSNKFRTLKEPLPEHVFQAAGCYGILLGGLGVEFVSFIYYAKDTSEMKEFYEPIHDGVKKQAVERIKNIGELEQEVVTTCKLPKPLMDKSSTACRYCPMNRVCHDTFFRADAQKLFEEKRNEEAPVRKTKPKQKAKKGLPKVLRRK